MNRDNFDRDLESYIRARRKGSGIRGFFNSLFAEEGKKDVHKPVAEKEIIFSEREVHEEPVEAEREFTLKTPKVETSNQTGATESNYVMPQPTISEHLKRAIIPEKPKVVFDENAPIVKTQPESKPEVRIEPKQDGFFSRFFSKKEHNHSTEIALKENQETVEDLKDVAKICLKVIQSSPDENVHAFKTSADFLRLKKILRKYELIK